ncbi:MAG: hypothetical protein LBN37_02350 [Bacteroidales bacterium]|jgi:hypothetical protein|nr:hypothetical protein [Bacteroidales bacterium]
MNQNLITPEEASAMILRGDRLLLAGDIALLSQLPKGNWIGGTTPFFILYPEHQVTSYEKLFVTKLPDYVLKTTIQEYDETNIKEIYNDAEKLGNVFTLLIMPYGSQVSKDFASNATYYENFACRPLSGWLTGRPLDSIMTEPSYAVSGVEAKAYTDKAFAMHIELPDTKYAELHIFNPFRQGKGDEISFEANGDILTDAIINGKKRNFAEYLREIGYDPKLPFVADYSGAMINVTCCGITDKEVIVSPPVFQNIEYRIAEIDDNISEPTLLSDTILYSITCIGNFIQPDICAQYLRKMHGPVVYGEVAYQLLGQTTVYITVDDIPNFEIEKA